MALITIVTCMAVLLGLSSHHTDADIVYAIYQGIVFSHLLHQDRIVGLDNTTESIRFTGAQPTPHCGCKCSVMRVIYR